MYYRPILKKSLDIIIKNKFLWILGFFAVFLGNGGVYDVLWRGWNFIIARTTVLSARFSMSSFEESGWFQTYNHSPWLFVSGLVLCLILCAGFIFLVISAQGGLIFAAQKLGATRKKIGLKMAWKEGMKKFWHLFTFNLLGRMLIFILLFLAGIPVFLSIGGEGKLGYVFSFVSFIIFIPLALTVSFAILYGLIHVVLKKADIRGAFHESLSLFKKFWLESLEFALILLGINLLLALVLAFLFIFLFLPFLVLGTGLFLIWGAVGLWVNIVLFILCCIAVFVLVGSVFGAFQMVAWTLFYLQLGKGDFISKITRMLGAAFRR
jgi:hypothetical protein